MSRKIIAIIPASGIGSRMGMDIPKQYLTLEGKTVLEHALSPFLQHENIEQIIVAVAPQDPHYIQLSVLQHPKISLVFGGNTRAQSVLNALKTVGEEEAWAVVHDAARPCLTRADLDQLLQAQGESGAILAMPVVDTIKRSLDGKHIVQTEDRSTLWHALTPQYFPARPLMEAIEQGIAQGVNLTDEASAMEFMGIQPQLVAGRSDNIKITRPEDLALATFYLSQHSDKEEK